METIILVVGIVLFVLLIISGVVVWWFFYNVSKCSGTDWVWDNSCLFFKELSYDASLKDPSEIPMYLADFRYVKGAGPSLCYPMWYRFVYVDVKTGGYSKPSPWTSIPIQSGASVFPCYESSDEYHNNFVSSVKCPFNTSNTCKFNQPVVGIVFSQYKPFVEQNNKIIGINVHRYTGRWNDLTPPDNSEMGEIIGILTNTQSHGVKYTCTDVVFNPCIGKSECGRCPGC